MSSEAKEFIVSTEYPGYAFLGWATGDSSRFARRKTWHLLLPLSVRK
jgi:hypothetical protein